MGRLDGPTCRSPSSVGCNNEIAKIAAAATTITSINNARTIHGLLQNGRESVFSRSSNGLKRKRFLFLFSFFPTIVGTLRAESTICSSFVAAQKPRKVVKTLNRPLSCSKTFQYTIDLCYALSIKFNFQRINAFQNGFQNTKTFFPKSSRNLSRIILMFSF